MHRPPQARSRYLPHATVHKKAPKYMVPAKVRHLSTGGSRVRCL